MHVVKNQITKNLGLLTPVIARELEEGFDREWGTSTTEWRSVHPWTTTLRITAGAANAAFCGPPLCTNILTTVAWTATDTLRFQVPTRTSWKSLGHMPWPYSWDQSLSAQLQGRFEL